MGEFMTLQKRKDSFIEKATAKWLGFYDYSLVDYKSSRDKVTIICPSHGEFLQTPVTHMTSRCPQCAIDGMRKKKTKTTSQFVIDAKIKHGDKYDYSRVIYINNKTKVEIVCNLHGGFLIAPGDHLKGQGCPECSYDKMRMKTDEFISKSSVIHRFKFDYSLSECGSSSDTVKIICPHHGVFEQRASDHLSGYGCGYCSGTKKLSTDEFITRCKEVHGESYDYSRTSYTSAHDFVSVACPSHGVFRKKAYKHMYGQGCPQCNDWLAERSFVYVLDGGGMVKIGVSKNVQGRISKITRSGQPFDCREVRSWSFKNFYESVSVEKAAHNRLKNHNASLSGFDGATEWFNISVDEAIAVVQREVYRHMIE